MGYRAWLRLREPPLCHCDCIEEVGMSDSEAALARTVLIYGPLSRRDLGVKLGLSPASLTRLAKPLVERGLLVELEEVADGTVGRPSRPLDIAPNLGSFVGVKITGDLVIAVATDIRAEQIAAGEWPIADTSPEAVLALVDRAVRGLDVPNLVAVGVSLGGVVHDGVAVRASFLEWDDVDVATDLGARLGVPVSVENDVVALAEAERWFGAGRGLSGFAVITIGAGVGYGLVVDNEVIRTPDATAGTGAHIPLDPFGPICSEGHRGCAQALLTSGSITAQASAALARPVGYDEILRLAEDGHPAVSAIVGSAADALGRLIALATNLSLQSTVVLSGEGVSLLTIVHDRVLAAAAAGRDPHANPIDLIVDGSGFRAWARGAAAVAIQSTMDRMRSRRQ